MLVFVLVKMTSGHFANTCTYTVVHHFNGNQSIDAHLTLSKAHICEKQLANAWLQHCCALAIVFLQWTSVC